MLACGSRGLESLVVGTTWQQVTGMVVETGSMRSKRSEIAWHIRVSEQNLKPPWKHIKGAGYSHPLTVKFHSMSFLTSKLFSFKLDACS